MDKKERAAYTLKLYHTRRAEAIEFLGGKCINCNSTKDLQLDHVDRETKSFQISQMWSLARATYDAEIAKCQILCESCHKIKTRKEIYPNADKRPHGALSTYSRGCRCDPCRGAYSIYWQSYKFKRPKRV